MNPEDLIGVWRLTSVTATRADGRRTEPYGPEPDGTLIYDTAGNMTTIILDGGLGRFVSGDIAAAERDEAANAYRRTLAYFGTYEMGEQSGTVLHHVRGSTFPNWADTTHLRFSSIEDGRLIMRTPPLPSVAGQDVKFTLIWEPAS